MFSESQPVLTIDRPTYDALVREYPEFMGSNWQNLIRSWSFGGVTVQGCANSGLATRVNSINRGPGAR